MRRAHVKPFLLVTVFVVACVDVGSDEVVVDRVVNVGGFAIEERIVREPTFHDPIFDHRWRVRVDGAWSELGTLRIEHARGIEVDRPPRVVDGHLAVPVGPQVLFRMRDGHTERADTHGCPVSNPVYGLWVRSIARRDGQWHIVFEPTTGHDTPAVEVRGSGSTWTCVLLDEGG